MRWIVILLFSCGAAAQEAQQESGQEAGQKQKIIYPKKTELDFEGVRLEGELRNPGEFYFQQKPPEKFDSLVKRRKNFHHQMLRDSVMIQ